MNASMMKKTKSAADIEAAIGKALTELFEANIEIAISGISFQPETVAGRASMSFSTEAFMKPSDDHVPF